MRRRFAGRPTALTSPSPPPVTGDRNWTRGLEPFGSGDGRSTLCGVMDKGNDHLYSIRAAGGKPKVVLGGERQITATRAADGWIAFLSTDPTHPAEVSFASE